MTSHLGTRSPQPDAAADNNASSPSRGRNAWRLALPLLALAAGGSALALKPLSISPQGEVSKVRQFVVTFDKPAVTAGNPEAPAPFSISCTSTNKQIAIPRYNGAWRNPSSWAADFDDYLPADVRCTAKSSPGFRSPTGETLETTTAQFHTGAPFVQTISPGGGSIDESQAFVLRFNGAVDAASVQAASHCEVEGIGEQVPTRVISGDDRAAILKSRWFAKEAEKQPDRFVVLQCNRTLPQSAAVSLTLGSYRSPGGLTSPQPQNWKFKVRPPFEATFSCERPNAQAACLPIRPVRLEFNAPVPMNWAKQVVLRSGNTTLQPDFSADEAKAASVEEIRFKPALPEQSMAQLVLPAGLKDDAGRPLQNADSFPLMVRTGPMPPLAKFAAAPFGVVERFAEGPDGPALLPITLRKVEAAPAVKALQPGGTVRTLTPESDAEIIRWYQLVRDYDGELVERTKARKDGIQTLPPALPESNDDEQTDIPPSMVQARMVSLLAQAGGAKATELPKPEGGDPRPFEVVGIPLQPGFHVLEIASPILGQNLLDPRFKQRTMYVRTSALVTNLGVHFKHGRAGSLAWVTRLDNGKPVPNASVAVSGCNGKLLASGKTDAKGIWRHEQAIEAPRCGEYDQESALFVSARAADDKGGTDMAFVWSDWNRGIESWRFDVPTSSDPKPDLRAHTVLDRTLLRAGETVSMKHYLRTETLRGLAAAGQMPTQLRITHVGSDESIELPLVWRTTATGGQTAESTWETPKAAKLGHYRVAQIGKDRKGEPYELDSGEFRVEEFRLPTMHGSIAPVQKDTLVGSTELPVQVQLAYLNGGAASGLPVQVSASIKPAYAWFDDYGGFSFSKSERWSRQTEDDSEDEDAPASKTQLLADRLALTLGKDGAGQVKIPNIPKSGQPQDVTLEASYSDPNGEIQTLQSRQRIWPAAVVAGIKTEYRVSVDKDLKFQALALDVHGKPLKDVKLAVRGVAHSTVTSRKRLVGGFYTYDNQDSSKDLGILCSGKSDSRGLLVCNARVDEPGEVELVASATDGEGRSTEASTSVTVTRQGEIWFGGEDHDRMDVLPEKRDYQPGETAQLQVRMPFRYATALLSVEREGILHSEVVELNGKDPTVKLKIQPEWGPNVYVSVLALRGRLRDVPWYSFFTWGYKAPREWWRAFWHDGKEYVAPTPLVDLSKPAFRLGMAALNVGVEGHALQVSVQPDKEAYQVRQQAQVLISAKTPDGKPAAHAEVAVAAVDQALLELKPNTSWDLLHAMFQQRAWGVETATAQMEIIGRRHYGRKAVPAGGDGGNGAATRELLDTLLLWNPRVQLDANGQARITVPLNDALTRFKVVAVADSGQDLFGTGEASIRTTQDLQIISGLPPLVREGDQYRAQITLRNTTKKDMQVEVTPKATLLELKPQSVTIPAGGSHEIAWDVTAPPQLTATRTQEIVWEVSARDTAGSKAADALKMSQRIIPAVPLTVQQGMLVQVDDKSISLAPPPQSLALADGKAAQGGVKIALQPSLAESLPGVRDWFANYPYVCLEQKASKAIGLRDNAMWQGILNELPTYLDADGLASYFPPQEGGRARGSDTLTAHLLASSHEAGSLNPRWQLSPAARDSMLGGLTRFVEGRIERDFWSPRNDRDVRKIAAIEALTRYGKAQPRMLTSITIAPNQWPTHAVIDWLSILQRMPSVPDRDTLLTEANQILRARLSYQGTRLQFSTERDDYWWWLMQNGDVNSARLILTVVNDPEWQNELPLLVNGFIARQKNGAWQTTNANLWGGLALERFAAKVEAGPVSGKTLLRMGGSEQTIDWSKVARLGASAQARGSHWFGAPATERMYTNNTAFLPWQNAPGAAAQTLSLQQQGSGKPWATVQALAAVPVKAPVSAGYSVKKTVTPVQQAVPGKTSRGDIWRVRLDINAATDMTWVAVSDPIPAGATVLGSGLGRDSAIATEGERASGRGWLAFVERSFEAYRAYYEYLPQGTTSIEYTLRLNNVGQFAQPATRVEALYAPEVFGVAPNAAVKVEAR